MNLDKYFKISENGSSVKTEVMAGVTTFMTLAYILAVNPDILSATGMDKGALFTATALSAVIATLLMGVWAKLPFALAPGMGLNAYFAFVVCGSMGYSWQFALTAILIEGVIFLVLSFFNIREMIVNLMPACLKKSISVGIGLFIALIGFINSGIVVANDSTVVSFGDIASGSALLTIIGLVLTAIMFVKKVPGALLIGMLVTTVIGFGFGITHMPAAIVSAPPSLAPIMFKFEFASIFTIDMVIVVFTFLFVDIFDTVGTLIGVATKSKMLDENGNLPRVKEALTCDAIGTVVGSALGTSTVTTYVESSAGVTVGGRTGLTSVVTAGCLALSLFFAPVALMVPGSATAVALILIGVFMASPITEINFEDYTESIPAFLTMVVMPFAYSIADGIGFGVISFTILKLCGTAEQRKQVNPMLVIVSILFIIKFII